METIVAALIAGITGIIGSLIVAAKTSNAMTQKLELQQAVQNERVESYQRTTNEKIDRLTQQVNAQATFGTEIALLKAENKQAREEFKQIRADITRLQEAKVS